MQTEWLQHWWGACWKEKHHSLMVIWRQSIQRNS
jgi:hypothetical protein